MEVHEMCIWRRTLKISWAVYKTNNEVLCRRTKDTDDKTETKTERMVGTCVTPRLITKESNWRGNERKKEVW